MKKIYILLALMAIGMAACEVENDSVFDESSTVRIEKLISDCDAMLQTSENGWKMVYVPNPEKHGGFNVLMKFEKQGRVVMATDFMEEKSNTTYSFNASQGAVLSFDTYSCLHYLADPAVAPQGKGMEGEFEFVVDEVTPDSIVFIGKKHGYKAVFLPATLEDWTELIPAAKINLERLKPQSNSPFFRSLTMNTTAVNLIYNPQTRAASVTWADEKNRKTETFLTAIYGTREGIAFMPALRINGVVVDGLKYNEVKEGFEVATPGVLGELKYTDEPPMPFYNSFTDLSTTSNAAALPLIGRFEFSINIVIEIMNLFSAMGDMSADLKTGYPLAVLAGMKQFKISWISPLDGMDSGTWLTWFGTTELFGEGQDYYFEGLDYEALRAEGDQVRFTVNNSTYTTNEEFATKMQGISLTKTFREFFTDPKGFTVVPAGNDEFYFVSIADSKRWMILSKN